MMEDLNFGIELKDFQKKDQKKKVFLFFFLSFFPFSFFYSYILTLKKLGTKVSMWACSATTFYRQYVSRDASFSFDGSILAVAYDQVFFLFFFFFLFCFFSLISIKIRLSLFGILKQIT